MATEQTGVTQSESTVDFDHPHPVRDFLAACGFSIQNFPHIRLVLEVPKKLLKNSQSFVPLRIPSKPGLVYESFARVIRVCEIPSATQGHRKLLEVDWFIDENALLESESHAAFSFVSSDVQCPSCKSIFLPDAQVIDEFSIRISCPSCLHYWTIRVESPHLSQPLPRLLTDVFYREPMKLRKVLSSAPLNHPLSGEYFPTNFKPWEDELSMSWLFEDRKGFAEIDGSIAHDDFDVLWKSFLNSQFHHYFSESREPKMTSNLDSTEIFRKSEIQQKITSNPLAITSPILKPKGREIENAWEAEFPFEINRIDDLPGVPVESKFRPSTSVRTEIRAADKYLAPKSFPWKAVIAASLFFTTVGLGYFTYHTVLGPSTTTESEELSTASILPSVSNEYISAPAVAQPPAPTPAPAIAKAVEAPPAVEVKKVASISKEEVAKKEFEKNREKEKEKDEQMTKARESIIEGSLRQGTQFMNDKQYDQASVEFKKVLELDPQNTFAYRNLGISYVYIQRYNEAIQIFERYLAIAKDDQDRAYIQEMLASLKDSSAAPAPENPE